VHVANDDVLLVCPVATEADSRPGIADQHSTVVHSIMTSWSLRENLIGMWRRNQLIITVLIKSGYFGNELFASSCLSIAFCMPINTIRYDMVYLKSTWNQLLETFVLVTAFLPSRNIYKSSSGDEIANYILRRYRTRINQSINQSINHFKIPKKRIYFVQQIRR